MRNALIIIALLIIIGAGTGYYYYDKEQKRIASETATRDSLRQVRELENARIAAMEQAHRDSIADYEKTHSPAVIRRYAEQLITEEMMSGRNRVGGKNWSERINILREQCDNVLAYNRNEEIDSIFRSFSFKGLMGEDARVRSDSVMRIYYVSVESAYVDVHFDLGEEIPEGQNVTYKLVFVEDKWLIDDFIFEYSDGDRVSESEEMQWFIDTFGKADDDEEEASDEGQKDKNQKK